MDAARFEDRYVPEPMSGCWLWTGTMVKGGYGRVHHDNRLQLAHRVSYQLHVGRPIPAGLELDHKCRVRSCVNPAHLEPVTHRENCRRGVVGKMGAARQKAKTHCPKGHPLSGENLYLEPRGTRQCRACRRAANRASRARGV